jgi:pimeloyl-ACP methyl ester carboxylesterase
MHNPALKRWLHRIDIPTLVILGSEDKVVSPRYGEGFCKEIAQARVQIIERAGHFAHIWCQCRVSVQVTTRRTAEIRNIANKCTLPQQIPTPMEARRA